MPTLRTFLRTFSDFRDPGVWLARAGCLWLLLAVAASFKAVTRPGVHSVYLYFPYAARHWWADLNLYAHYPGFDPYRYSPTFAVAASPFGAMPDAWGGAVWIFCNVCLLVWAMHSWARMALPGGWTPGGEAAFLALALPASIGGIWSAQSNALILSLVIFSLLAIRRQQWWRASALLAAPVFIKIWPLAVVLMLMVRWPRQLVGRFVVSCAILAAVPFATRPWPIVWRHYHDWYAALTGPLQGRWGGYRDAWTIWEQLGPPVDAHAYKLLQLASLATVLVWCLWQSRRLASDTSFLAAVLAIWSAWQLLFGPGTERLTYGLVAPSLAMAVLASHREQRLRVLSYAAWGLVSLFSMGDIEKQAARVLPHAEVLLPFGIVAFVVWIAVWRWPRLAPLGVEVPHAAAAHSLAPC